MKYGIRVVIHKDISKELLDEANEMCDYFVKLTCRGHIYKSSITGKWTQKNKGYGNGGWKSYWKRKVFGLLSQSKKLVFRRLSNNRRIFGVVPLELLRDMDNTIINIKRCVCPIHLGGIKVTMLDGPYDEQNYNMYCEFGDIKG